MIENEVYTSEMEKVKYASRETWEPLKILADEELTNAIIENTGGPMKIVYEHEEVSLAGCRVLTTSDVENGELNVVYTGTSIVEIDG